MDATDLENAVKIVGGGKCTLETVEHEAETKAAYTTNKVVCNL